MSNIADFHVIDDSRYIVEFAVTVLKSEGYDCLGFTSSAEYLARIKDGSLALPRCVITDLSMPEVSGGQLMREILDRQTDQRFIAMTGFSTEPLDKEMVCIYLSKPFRVEELLEAARTILKCTGSGPAEGVGCQTVGDTENFIADRGCPLEYREKE